MPSKESGTISASNTSRRFQIIHFTLKIQNSQNRGSHQMSIPITVIKIIMSGRPVSYLCFKSIIYYMDATLRFDLVRCCPDLEKVEKEVPLKIQSLSFGDYFEINKASYSFTLVREALGEGLNSKYGFECDGDNKLICYDKTGFDSMKPGTTWDCFDDYFNSEEEIAENARLEALRKEMDDSPRVKGCHSILLKYQVGPDVYLERVAYNKTLRKANEYLVNKFLSGRRSVQVGWLQIFSDNLGMPPLPSKAKLRVFHLMHMENKEGRFDALKAILDGTPLESVRLESPENFDSTVVSTAKTVIVNDDAPVLLEIGSELSRVHAVGTSYRQERLAVLLNPLTTQGRPAGTLYSVEICDPRDYEDLFNAIKQTRGSKVIKMDEAKNVEYSEYGILPVNDGSELHVCCDPYEDKEGGIVKFQFYQKGKTGFSLSS